MGGTNIKKRGSRKLSTQQDLKIKVNEEIDYHEVRLIDADGSQRGVVSAKSALEAALEQGLDLVEVSDKADPPVCRIMNFDKFRYELKKKQQEAKKKQTVIETKEIKFRPKTEEHDLAFKIRKIKEFLAEKNKVKVTMRFRGREIIYAQTIGLDALTKIADTLREDCVIIQEPKMEGRQLVMFVGPKS
ncbi:MAG: translation initiation factor IF-3 [Desulfobulbus sp.]|jgi:translation initiation factor IF-3|uniref:translation initiation factor IF-3 n=1 Tax=Desulfobulbus sp. TaxID=895 RepID=UPI002851095D|nr:translation initiation factor IF-3 [Desulfobulbus sp.]MDR2549164.1 translation initiation factor IF-3 [Desulfobulbus sp.]